MRKYLILLIILTGCQEKIDVRDRLSLAGEWKFKIDSLNQGLENKWYESSFDETVILPGSMAENGKGDDVTLETPWTGDIIDRSYFTEGKYEKYRQK
jgi:beta-galactosidase/beta-glucuronidase